MSSEWTLAVGEERGERIIQEYCVRTGVSRLDALSFVLGDLLAWAEAHEEAWAHAMKLARYDVRERRRAGDKFAKLPRISA